MGQGGQRNGQKGGQPLFPQHLLQQLGPPPGAAEHQCAELHLLIVGKIRRGGVHTAAVAGKLLGGHGQKKGGQIVCRVLGTGEGVKVYGTPSGKPVGKVLPLAAVVAKLSDNQTGLQGTVQRHAHFFRPGAGGSLKGCMVAQNPKRIPGNVVGCGGIFGINESHVPVGGGGG